MLKKAITFTDLNEVEVTEIHYFHFSKAEIVELQLSHSGGLEHWLETIVAAENSKAIYAELKKIILSSYGKRSEDGRHFVKNDQLREEFESSEAYSALVMEMFENPDAATAFVRGALPKDLAEEAIRIENLEKLKEAQKRIEDANDNPEITDEAPEAPDETPVVEKEKITLDDLHKMSSQEFIEAQERIKAGTAEFVDPREMP